MLKSRSFWEASVLVIGAGAIVTGLVILATDRQVVDHRYGAGLTIGGGILVLAALVALFCLAREKNDQPAGPIANIRLGQRSIDLAQEVAAFSTERQRLGPSILGDGHTWAAHLLDTMNEYHRRFGGRVIAARDQLVAAGVADGRLQSWVFERPTNFLGLAELTQTLEAIGRTTQGEG